MSQLVVTIGFPNQEAAMNSGEHQKQRALVVGPTSSLSGGQPRTQGTNLPGALPPLQSARLLEQLRERIRYVHYSLRTEQAYVHWVRAYVRFHGMKHPQSMGAPEIESFLLHLVNVGGVAASTHRQALSALLFLYRKVYEVDLP